MHVGYKGLFADYFTGSYPVSRVCQKHPDCPGLRVPSDGRGRGTTSPGFCFILYFLAHGEKNETTPNSAKAVALFSHLSVECPSLHPPVQHPPTPPPAPTPPPWPEASVP